MKNRHNSAKGRSAKKNVEQGAVVKKGRNLVRAALVYPNTYRAGMSSLGYQTVYRLANQLETIACERIFWDPKRREPGGPKSLESGKRLDKFDVILFSVSFENDYIHLVQLLGEAGIPLRSPDRNHIHPLVVAGGVACFLNPEPIAPFMDCFLLGEAECLIENFFAAFTRGRDKRRLLDSLEEKVPGAYVPGRHTDGRPFKIQVQVLDTLEKVTTASCLISSETAFKNIFLLETMKGCPHGCRFCSAGFIYRPPRHYPLVNLTAAVDAAPDTAQRIGLVSSAVADHPQINELCRHALDKGYPLSFASLRADKLDDAIIEALCRSKTKTATIAPEAGSERMRQIINKHLNESDILTAVTKLVSNGIINLKLYFMIGLPFETMDDVHAIVDLTRKIKQAFLAASKRNKKIGTITLSVNPFIPKPATPFQWCAMTDEKKLKKRVTTIKNGLKTVANVTVNVESMRKARLHALFSLGTRDTADVIETAAAKGWTFALKQHAAHFNDVVCRPKDTREPLPWDFIATGVKTQFLKTEYQRASTGRTSSSCPMTDCRVCRKCIDKI